jgi:hypothetical protein
MSTSLVNRKNHPNRKIVEKFHGHVAWRCAMLLGAMKKPRSGEYEAQIAFYVSEQTKAHVQEVADQHPRYGGKSSAFCRDALNFVLQGVRQYGLSFMYPDEGKSPERTIWDDFDSMREELRSLAAVVKELQAERNSSNSDRNSRNSPTKS